MQNGRPVRVSPPRSNRRGDTHRRSEQGDEMIDHDHRSPCRAPPFPEQAPGHGHAGRKSTYRPKSNAATLRRRPALPDASLEGHSDVSRRTSGPTFTAPAGAGKLRAQCKGCVWARASSSSTRRRSATASAGRGVLLTLSTISEAPSEKPTMSTYTGGRPRPSPNARGSVPLSR